MAKQRWSAGHCLGAILHQKDIFVYLQYFSGFKIFPFALQMRTSIQQRPSSYYHITMLDLVHADCMTIEGSQHI